MKPNPGFFLAPVAEDAELPPEPVLSCADDQPVRVDPAWKQSLLENAMQAEKGPLAAPRAAAARPRPPRRPAQAEGTPSRAVKASVEAARKPPARAARMQSAPGTSAADRAARADSKWWNDAASEFEVPVVASDAGSVVDEPRSSKVPRPSVRVKGAPPAAERGASRWWADAGSEFEAPVMSDCGSVAGGSVAGFRPVERPSERPTVKVHGKVDRGPGSRWWTDAASEFEVPVVPSEASVAHRSDAGSVLDASEPRLLPRSVAVPDRDEALDVAERLAAEQVELLGEMVDRLPAARLQKVRAAVLALLASMDSRAPLQPAAQKPARPRPAQGQGEDEDSKPVLRASAGHGDGDAVTGSMDRAG